MIKERGYGNVMLIVIDLFDSQFDSAFIVQ